MRGPDRVRVPATGSSRTRYPVLTSRPMPCAENGVQPQVHLFLGIFETIFNAL